MIATGYPTAWTILAQLTVSERLKALQETESSAEGSAPLVWVVVTVLGAVAVIVGALVVSWIRELRQRKTDWADMLKTARQTGLGDTEVDLLEKIALCSPLKENASAVMTSEVAFNEAAARYRHSEDFDQADPDLRVQRNQMIGDIRRKLGLENYSNAVARGSHQLEKQAKVKLIHPDDGENGSVAFVVRSNDDCLVLQPRREDVDMKPGQSWHLRYFDGRSLWEFDTPILDTQGGHVMVAHDEQGRILSRRRFSRIPVDFKAMICPYLFDCKEPSLVPPEWSEAHLVELAGPGLKIKTTLELQMNQRVLLITQIGPNATVRGVGVIRRIDHQRHMMKEVAVELTDLTRQNIARLAAATNMASAQEEIKRKQAAFQDKLKSATENTAAWKTEDKVSS